MIYYLEDDPNIRELVLYTLAQTGYEAHGFSRPETFWADMRQEAPDLILLDLMLPEEDGISILSTLRGNSKTAAIPVILVTAKDSEFDKVTGLDCGADDYVTKPFGMMELVSRIKAVLRRTAPKPNQELLSAGELVVDITKHVATCGGVEVSLSCKEFALLQFLLENRGRVYTRDQLLEAVWGYNYAGGTRTVDVHVQTLRQKIGDCASVVETVRGVGYRAKE